MTISHDQSISKRIRNELLSLQKQDATEAKKVASNTQKQNQALATAQRTSSASTASMKLRDAERYAKEAERAQSKRAEVAEKISRKTEELHRVDLRLNQKIDADQKKRQQEVVKVRKAQERRLKELEMQAKRGPTIERPQTEDLPEEIEVDVFISHASEDKEDFVRQLAEKARQAGIRIWYDEFSLKWGDSLRRKIDEGLSKSHFGVVVLSEAFFSKEWTQYELDSLIEKEVAGEGSILPIWHKVSKDEVRKYSLALSNRLALNTSSLSIDDIANELLTIVKQLRQ